MHPGRRRSSGRMKLKNSHKVLLVVFCDTHVWEIPNLIICRVLVVVSPRPTGGSSLQDAEKSVSAVSFTSLLLSRLVLRVSKCQKRFLLKKRKIVDTYIAT